MPLTRPAFVVLWLLAGLRAAEPRPEALLIAEPAAAAPVEYGIRAVSSALVRAGWQVRRSEVRSAEAGGLVILVGPAASAAWRAQGGAPLVRAEEHGLRQWSGPQGTTIAAAGADEAGLMYALLGLADRIREAPRGDLLAVVETAELVPAVRDRAVSLHVSDPADWAVRLRDEATLVRQLDALVAARFNRVRLVPGTARGLFPIPTWRLWVDPDRSGGAAGSGSASSVESRNRALLRRFLALARERALEVTLAVRWGGIGAAEGPSDRDLAALERFVAEEPGLGGMCFLPDPVLATGEHARETKLLDLLRLVRGRRPDLRLELPQEWVSAGLLSRLRASGVEVALTVPHWSGSPGPSFPSTPPAAREEAGVAPWPPGVPITWALGEGAAGLELPWGGPEQVRRLLEVTRSLAFSGWDLREPAVWARGSGWTSGDFLLQAWGRCGFSPSTVAEEWRRSHERAFGAAGSRLRAASELAGTVTPLVAVAVQPPAVAGGGQASVERHSLGRVLADYAARPAGDAVHAESLAEAARRILTGGVTARRTPEETMQELERVAESVLADVAAAEAVEAGAIRPGWSGMVRSLRAAAWLARFHARRMRAAVHYNLFLRGQKLAELVAATFGEKDAVAAWRELVRLAEEAPVGAPLSSLARPWREELGRLEQSQRELEDMCCPPDDAVLREKVWSPLVPEPLPWSVEHARPDHIVAGEPLRLAFRLPGAPTGVKLWLSHGPVGGSRISEELSPGARGEHSVTLPGDPFRGRRAWSYHVEVRDSRGRVWAWPKWTDGNPMLVVPVVAP